MSTLLVYFTEDPQIRRLCEQSRADGTQTLELLEHFDRSALYISTVGSYMALAGKSSVVINADVNLDAYDSVIIASPVWAGNPAPAINAFLRANDLKGKTVTGILFGAGMAGALANDVLRKRIALAGGTCRDVMNIQKKEITRCAGTGLVRLALAGA